MSETEKPVTKKAEASDKNEEEKNELVNLLMGRFLVACFNNGTFFIV